MQRVKDFWNSGVTGKASIIGVVVLAFGCCLCAGLSVAGIGLSEIVPALFAPATPTVATTVTPTGETGSETAGPTLTETGAVTLTGSPDVTITATPTMTPTATTHVAALPSATPQPPIAVPPTQPPAPTSAPKPPPAPTATSAPFGYTITFLTSPILAGQNVTLKIKTAPNSACNLSYVTPQGDTSNMAGLGATTADGNGVCSWTWKITPNTKPGTGKLFITAGGVTGEKDITIQ